MIDLATRHRHRRAAQRAKQVYPGPVGELLSQEIASYEEFGHLIRTDSLIPRVIDHIMDADIPAVPCP